MATAKLLTLGAAFDVTDAATFSATLLNGSYDGKAFSLLTDDASNIKVTVGFSGTTGTITIPSVGVVTVTGTGTTTTATFVADSALTTSIELTQGAGTTWTSATASATGSNIIASAPNVTLTGGAGNDTLTASAASDVITAGAGNDTIKVTATAATGATLTGGDGTDTFDLSTSTIAAAGVSIADYKYSQGDVIKEGTTATTVLTPAGALTVNNGGAGMASAALTAETDGAYKAIVSSTDALSKVTTKEYWTSANNAVAALDASAITNSVVIDGSADANGASLSGGTANDTITAGAGNDVVWGGAGNDSIVLDAVATDSDTVYFGTGNGKDTVDNFKAGNDTIKLYNGSVSDLTVIGAAGVGATLDVTIKAGDSTLFLNDVGASATAPLTLTIADKDGATKKVAYDVIGTQTFTADKAANVADLYVGNNSTLDYSANTTAGLKVDLYSNPTTYKGISTVKTGLRAGTYIGNASATTDIDASVVAESGTQIWGGSSKINNIALSTVVGGTQETVWFGTADGTDAVTNFGSGYANTNDVLKLYDITDLSQATFTAGTAAIPAVRVGSSVISLDGAAVATNGTNILIDVANTVKKVAFSSLAGTAATLTGGNDTNGFSDYVAGSTATDTVTYATATTGKVINLQDTTMYRSIENVIDGAGNDTIIGSASNASSISAATGGNDAIWGGSSANDTITVNGKDTVWYGGSSDGNDTVTGFDNTNTLKLWDMSLTEFADNLKTVSAPAVTSLKLGFGSNSVELQNALAASAGTIKLEDENGNTGNVVVNLNAAGALAYDTKAKLYIGNGSALAVTTSMDATLYLDNNRATAQYGTMSVNDITFSGVTELNASAGTGNYTLVGSALYASTLDGGMGTTAMWGGGSAANVMNGGAGVDTAWFGTGDGLDSFADAKSNDKVVLWNATSISDLTATYDGTTGLTIATTSGDRLAITASAATDYAGLTFQVGTSSSASKYTYDTTTKTFKKA